MNDAPLPRKLAAVLYTDVAGYSRLTADDEEGTHRRLSDSLDRIAAHVRARRGRVVHYAGDAVLADFSSASDALACALTVQRDINARNSELPEARRLLFRIGVNLGEVIDDRGDVYGDGVNVAARLQTLAQAGGICVSDALRVAVGRRLPVTFEDLGACEVKNIPQPVHAWRVVDAGEAMPQGAPRARVVLRAEARAFGVLMGDDDALARSALNRARAQVVAAVESNGGAIADTPGDTVVSMFDDAAKALAAAMAARKAVANSNRELPPESRVHYRFGLDAGVVKAVSDGPAGPAVEGAARLSTSVSSDGIAFSEAVRTRLPHPGEYTFSVLEAGTYVLSTEEAEPGVPSQIDTLALLLPKKPSIVLLPFACIGEDPETRALADGLRVDMQSGLVQLANLFVIAAGSAGAFDGKSGVDAGPRLGVRHALEGTVQRAGNQVRIHVQLTDTTDGSVAWSERYDRTLEDTFTLQDEITEHVVTTLDVKLLSGEQGRLWRRCLTHAKARALFYRALQEFFRMTPESIAAARSRYERVAELVPDSALGPSSVAMCLWFEFVRGWSDDPTRTRAEAGQWAERAVDKEDADGQAHTVLGNVRLLQGRHDEALAVAREAIVIRPGCTNANGFLANVLLHCDAAEEAVTHARRAIRFSPVYPPWFVEILAGAYRESAQPGLAIVAAREVLRVAPQSINARVVLATALVRAGWGADASRIAEEICELDPAFSSARFAAAQPFREESVRERLDQDLREAGLPN